jgi:hypothetical protein
MGRPLFRVPRFKPKTAQLHALPSCLAGRTVGFLSRQEIRMEDDGLGRAMKLVGIAAASAVVVAAVVITAGRLLLL